MRSILSERNIVVVLFVMVFITFSLAHEDSKKMERVYLGFNSSVSSTLEEIAKNEITAPLPSTVESPAVLKQ